MISWSYKLAILTWSTEESTHKIHSSNLKWLTCNFIKSQERSPARTKPWILNTPYYEKIKIRNVTFSNHHFGYDVDVDTVGVSLSDITFQMNGGSSFRSLWQLVSSVQTNFEMSRDHSIGAIGPIFDPSAQVGSHDSQIAGGLPSAKPYRTLVWVDDTAQVSQNPTLTPDDKKVKFDQRLCGDAMVAHLKREIPEITATRWVRQFSTNMVYILSAPHQLRPNNGER